MSDDGATLARLISFLAAQASVEAKVTIQAAYAPAEALAGNVSLGDDCAAIPDGDQWLLLAAEGMLESFVAADPWFAGYSAVMVNLSDVAAMGGRAIAIVDILWTPGLARSKTIWEGMTAASRAYGVPIVGGHTTNTKAGPASLAAAVLGRAHHLITSFDAQPGDDLLMAVDLRGAWRGARRRSTAWRCNVSAVMGLAAPGRSGIAPHARRQRPLPRRQRHQQWRHHRNPCNASGMLSSRRRGSPRSAPPAARGRSRSLAHCIPQLRIPA